ncbi:MAG TPA: DNA translocase FtsK [Verrucomicrobiota bacterium]|nr:cell division protein FtsK [Verrucomicrobiales bacterium]HRI11733.1 DNA translocase FtsK [Verrucomicrobiota bacterium]
MPRERTETESDLGEPSGNLTGLVLLILAGVLALALFSYDRADLATNASPPNHPIHNLLGRVGATVGDVLLFGLGAGAYLLPVLLAGFGLARFVPALGYLRRGWRAPLAALGLLGSVMGMLDLFSAELPSLGTRGNSLSAGGLLGAQLNSGLVVYFLNRTGAALVYTAVYLGSLVLLTDSLLLGFLKKLFIHEPKTEEERLAATQAKLEREAKRLAQRARKLEEKAAAEGILKRGSAVPTSAEREDSTASGLGADLQPVPVPKFRDHSVSKVGGAEPAPEGTRITAEEIAKSSPPSVTDAILGRPAAAKAVAEDTVSAEADSPAESESGDVEPVPSVVPVVTPRGKLQPRRAKPISVATTPLIGNYQLPPFDLLHLPDLTVRPTETKEELMANSRLMVQTLAQFGIEVAAGDITRGPTITRYELHPAPGVKLEKINALTNNIAAALKAERIHILAPIPGKSSVGIEVPNAVKTKVIMRDLLESEEWKHTKARIPLALGKDVYGQPVIADLADMPHVLIAGSTGSGKSVCINTIVASLLYRFSPDQLRFVMIDPKVVELQQYNALPHLVVPVVTDPKKVILALRWVVNEMEKRYQIFARVGVRNVKAFNERPKDRPPAEKQPELPLLQKKEKIEAGADGFAVEVDEEIVVPRDEDIVIPEKLSYIVVIIDELADLMLVAPADVEMAIARITQMARAAGIHCIVATQRPSVDVITGVIKANIPARIAFQVASKVDSRTILDQMGADKLLGKGDMLYLPPGSAKLNRAQGALITDAEIERVVQFIARQGKPSYDLEIHHALQKVPSSAGSMNLDPDQDDSGLSDGDEVLITKAMDVIRSEKKASTSLLQRRLKIGYGRAARLLDTLEDRGVVGPSKGAEPRDILIDLDGQGFDGGGQQMV